MNSTCRATCQFIKFREEQVECCTFPFCRLRIDITAVVGQYLTEKSKANAGAFILLTTFLRTAL